MATKTKKVKSAGRFGAGYGIRVKERLRKVEKKQRKRQVCPFCKKQAVKRVSRAIWKCNRCKKKFASGVFYVE